MKETQTRQNKGTPEQINYDIYKSSVIYLIKGCNLPVEGLRITAKCIGSSATPGLGTIF